MLSFENRYVRVLGPSLDLKLPSAGPVSLALRARYSDQGYKASDAAELEGMDERKGGLWLGARADWRLPFAQLSAEWQGDANGRSDGQQMCWATGHCRSPTCPTSTCPPSTSP